VKPEQGFGLPKAALLKTNREFDRVYRNGRRVHGKGFSIIHHGNGLPMNRLGISVQRKVGGAVRRNRIKRLIREIFRTNRDHFPLQSDIVVTVRPGFAFDGYAPLHRAMMESLCPNPTKRA
jgi:ribonuclease P protein component